MNIGLTRRCSGNGQRTGGDWQLIKPLVFCVYSCVVREVEL